MLLLGFCTTSFAYTFDEFIEFCKQIADEEIITNSEVISMANKILSFENDIRSMTNVNQYTNFIVTQGKDNYWYCVMSGNDMNVQGLGASYSNFYCNGFTTPNYNMQFKGSTAIWSNWKANMPVEQNHTTYTTNISNTFGLITGSINNVNGRGFFNSLIVPPTYYFTPFHDVTNLTVNNISNINGIYWNSRTKFLWGRLENYNEIEASNFRFFLASVDPNGNEVVLFDTIQWNLLFLGTYIWQSEPRLIYTNQLYKIGISYNDKVESFYYYVLPYNQSISNGSTITYNYNSGDSDYTIQSQTNDIINNVSDVQTLDNTLNNLSSGEIISQLNFKEYPNHSYDILFALTQNIVNTLYGSGDVYIDIPFNHNNFTYRVYASQFITPLNNLTQFIILAVNFGFVYLIYRQASEIIHTIEEGDLYVLELEDADEYFYM